MISCKLYFQWNILMYTDRHNAYLLGNILIMWLKMHSMYSNLENIYQTKHKYYIYYNKITKHRYYIYNIL